MTRAAESDWSGAVAAFDVAVRVGDAVTDLDVLGNLGNAALQLGDDAAQQHFYALGLSRAREAGAVMARGLRAAATVLRPPRGRRLVGRAQLRGRGARARPRASGHARSPLPPLAWLTLLAALQGRPEYDDRLRELEEVAGAHPLGILTDPVHDLTRWAKGSPRHRRLGHLRSPAPPAPAARARPSPGWLPSTGSTPPSAPTNPSWPAAGSRSSPGSPSPPAGPGRWPPSPTAAP